jgi:hypothetical protein
MLLVEAMGRNFEDVLMGGWSTVGLLSRRTVSEDILQ